MPEISFCCPKCGHAYRFAADLGGKRGRCKVCKEVFRIPVQAAPDPKPAEGASPAPVAAPRRRAKSEKIVFNCPTCGHGYRLSPHLAGKQGRCTTCRGIFTIPLQSPAEKAPRRESEPTGRRREPQPSTRGHPPSPTPAHPKSSVPNGARSGSPSDRGVMTFLPIPDDHEEEPECWELDSSELRPVTTAGARLKKSATPVIAPPGPTWAVPGEEVAGISTAPAKPGQPRWVRYAAISGGVIVGIFTFMVTFSLVSNAVISKQPAVADRPDGATKAPGPPVAETIRPRPGPSSNAAVGGMAAHQAVVDAMAGAYNEIADGYARIRDAATIREGQQRVAGAVERLKAAAQRGRSLVPLEAGERAAFARSSGPPLLRAVDRVIQELHRLKTTPGLKADFDRLIAAYTRTRQEIDREIRGNATGPPLRVGPGPQPPSLKGMRPGPSGPRGRLRGRR